MKYGIYELNNDPDDPVDYGIGVSAKEARAAASRRARQLIDDGEITQPVAIRPVDAGRPAGRGMVRADLFVALALLGVIVVAIATLQAH